MCGVPIGIKAPGAMPAVTLSSRALIAQGRQGAGYEGRYVLVG